MIHINNMFHFLTIWSLGCTQQFVLIGKTDLV